MCGASGPGIARAAHTARRSPPVTRITAMRYTNAVMRVTCITARGVRRYSCGAPAGPSEPRRRRVTPGTRGSVTPGSYSG